MTGGRNLGRVFLTGGTGFLGQHLLRQLERLGVPLLSWTRADGDLADVALISKAISDFAPDTVFHVAAEGVKNPNLADETLITRNRAMIDSLAAGLKPAVRFISAGSMTEYGQSGILTESMVCTPLTDYNRGKLQAGQRLAELAPEKQLEAVHARLFHLYGSGEPPHRLFPTLFTKLGAGEAVNLSDCQQTRDLVHVEDAARWLIRLATCRSSHIAAGQSLTVNVGTGIAPRLRDVVTAIADALGADHSLLRFAANTRAAADLDDWVADTTLLTAMLGDAPPQRISGTIDPALFTDCRC